MKTLVMAGTLMASLLVGQSVQAQNPPDVPERRERGAELTEDVQYVPVDERRGLLSFMMPNRTIPDHAVGMKYDLLPLPNVTFVGCRFRAVMFGRKHVEELNIGYWQEWRVGQTPWRAHLVRVDVISPGNCSSLVREEVRVGFALTRKF